MTKRNMVIGYVGTRNLPLLQERDIDCLDVINLAFGVVKNHAVHWDIMEHHERLKQIKKQHRNVKLVLSIGGWGSGGFSEASSTAEGRNTFAKTAVELVEKYGLDGLDVDWEYPCIGIAGIEASLSDKENFTLLIERTRRELDTITDRRTTLSIAAGGDRYYTRCTQMERVSKYLDYVMLMTYDLRGGFSVQTGHHTNLYSERTDLSGVSAHHAVQVFIEAGVPREKLVIGAAFYSRSWKGVPDRNNGYMQMAETTGGYGPDYGTLAADYVDKNGYTRYWDEEAKAPYLFNGSEFISYDDQESVGYKIQYVKEQRLAGIMFWEFSQDTTRVLAKMMAEQLRDKDDERNVV